MHRGGAGVRAASTGAGAIHLVREELQREVHETDTGPVEVAELFGFFLPLFLAGVAGR